MLIGILTIIIVFMAGVVSFLSPCVFPILPAYLSLISGLSYEEIQSADEVRKRRWRLLGSALAFVFGFSLVIVLLLGGVVSFLSELPEAWEQAIRYVGGAIMVVFALHMFGVFRIKALFNERRFRMNSNKWGYLGAALIGIAFAFGWSPCIGPILSGVVLTAGSATTWLLIVYTLGLAVPFMLSALFVNVLMSWMSRLTRHMRVVEIASGVLLVCMSVLLVSGKLAELSMMSQGLPSFSSHLEAILHKGVGQ